MVQETFGNQEHSVQVTSQLNTISRLSKIVFNAFGFSADLGKCERTRRLHCSEWRWRSSSDFLIIVLTIVITNIVIITIVIITAVIVIIIIIALDFWWNFNHN